MHALLRPRVFITLAVAGAGAAYAASTRVSSPPSTATPDRPPARLTLTYDKPVVGARVRASAVGLPPNTPLELRWTTVSGGWVVEDDYHFRGKKYAEATTSLGRFHTDAVGRLDAPFTIPDDYGGVHDVVAVIGGTPVAQNGIEVTQTFEMMPRSGPVGTMVELNVKGLGWRTMESTWVVNWDNKEIGWVSAASTRGAATARFRAAGPEGDHIVKVYTGWQGQPYLNHEQSPVAHLPRPQFTFRTTAGRVDAPAAFVEPYPRQPVPPSEAQLAGASLSLAPTQGPVGTRAMLRGSGLPSRASLRLVWQTYVGSRVSGESFAPEERDLTRVEAGADGELDAPVTIPDDLGGLHRLVVRHGDRTIGQTHFVIETSIVGITPVAGPVGTPVTIHLKGVGWTEYDNILIATYDNAYMGYACGFNSAGDVVINFTAAGPPGVHLIDLYPGIYQGPPTEPQLLYRTPQLTYRDDHPGNKIPALRFAFEVTGPGSLAAAQTR